MHPPFLHDRVGAFPPCSYVLLLLEKDSFWFKAVLRLHIFPDQSSSLFFDRLLGSIFSPVAWYCHHQLNAAWLEITICEGQMKPGVGRNREKRLF